MWGIATALFEDLSPSDEASRNEADGQLYWLAIYLSSRKPLMFQQASGDNTHWSMFVM